LRHWPPRALQPETDRVERKFAHSDMLALPRITAPASFSRFATCESLAGIEPSSASDPAVVVILSFVSTLSFTSTGMPCSGPRGPFGLSFRIEGRRDLECFGFVSMTLRSSGPFLSSSAILCR
jgi:hypothetical protein